VLHVRGESAVAARVARAAWRSCSLLLVAAAAALAACGGSTSSSGQSGTSGPARAGGTIVWGKPAEVASIDPTTNEQDSSWQLLSVVYEQLVGIDDNLRPTPKLAQSWSQPSPTTYVFNIRRGVRFSNGRMMTVDDVIGSLERLTDPKLAAPWAPFVGEIKSVTSPAPWQVKVVLKQPNAAFVPSLVGASASIIPMKELRAGTWDPRKSLLGTGPYMVASHSQDEVWNLARNPYYWQKGKPHADKLTIRIVKDDAARIAGLRDGSIDIANFDTPDAVKLLQGQPNIKTVVVQSNNYFILDLNAKSSIFKDPRLREAVSLTLDRSEIAKVALAGASVPSAAVPPRFGLCEPSSMPYGTPDPQRAAQLVAAAGAKGKTVSMLASTTYKPLAQIAQVLQPALEAAGLKVRIEQPDQGEWIKRVYSGKAEFDIDTSFTGSYGDPSMGLAWWGPGQAWGTAWNPTDKVLWDLVAKSHTQAPGPARDATIKAACARVARHAVLIPLDTQPLIIAYRSDKLNALPPKADGYGYVMRNVADFSANGG
jgi:peptide/nickel transport system substrate-binding protein